MNKLKFKRSKTKIVKDTLILGVLIILMPFAPLTLLIMWKFVDWTKKTKWIVSGILLSLFTIGCIGYLNAPPNISVQGAKDNKAAVNATTYELKGDISSYGQIKSFEINGKPISLSNGRAFAYSLPLKEGENTIELIAKNDSGESRETITISRPTKAESEASALAVKEQQDKTESKNAAEKDKVAKENARKEQEASDAKARQEAKKAEESSKKAEKEKADSQCNFWCKLTGGDKKKETDSKAGSSCNFWCKLTGGDKKKEDEKQAKEKAAKEKTRKEQEAATAKKQMEAKKVAEAAAAEKRVQDLLSCSVDVSSWTEKEINEHREKYGECGGFDLVSVCEQWFKSRYPYKGSKMHWIVDLRQQGKMPDGSKFLIVGVTIENAFGAERSATLECAGKYAGGGMVTNTVFNVY